MSLLAQLHLTPPHPSEKLSSLLVRGKTGDNSIVSYKKSHRDVKYIIGNIVNNIVIIMYDA